MRTVTIGAIAALMISVSSANAATVGFDFGGLFKRVASHTSAASSSSPFMGGGFSFFGGLPGLTSGGGGTSGGAASGAVASLLSQLFGGGLAPSVSAPEVQILVCDDCDEQGEVVVVSDTPSEVPLPAAGFLLIGGLAGLGIMRRRKG